MFAIKLKHLSIPNKLRDRFLLWGGLCLLLSLILLIIELKHNQLLIFMSVLSCFLQPEKTYLNLRYFHIVFSCLLLAFSFRLNILCGYYLCFIFQVYLLFGIAGRRLSLNKVMVLLLASPLFDWCFNIVGFEIRMSISSALNELMQSLGFPSQLNGTELCTRGNCFTIEAACAGLNLFQFGLLYSILLPELQANSLKKKSSFGNLMFSLSIGLFLIICSNFFRILLLILFNIPPENIMHEIVGLVCFIVYVILPLIWINKHFSHLLKEQPESKEAEENKYIISFYLLTCILMLAFVMTSINSKKTLNPVQEVMPNGFANAAKIKNETYAIHNNKEVIYIKPLRTFYTSEHHPELCWRGSGYQLDEVKACEKGYNCYTGKLSKGNEILYTAWWYTNNKKTTFSQLEWRLDMVTGEPPYWLINITCSKKTELLSCIKKYQIL